MLIKSYVFRKQKEKPISYCYYFHFYRWELRLGGVKLVANTHVECLLCARPFTRIIRFHLFDIPLYMITVIFAVCRRLRLSETGELQSHYLVTVVGEGKVFTRGMPCLPPAGSEAHCGWQLHSVGLPLGAGVKASKSTCPVLSQCLDTSGFPRPCCSQVAEVGKRGREIGGARREDR